MAGNYTPLEITYSKKDSKINEVSITKESEPIPTEPEKTQLQEVSELEPEESVKPYVKIPHTVIDLPPDLKKIGLKPVSSASFTSVQNVKTPISDDKVIVGLHAPITSSFRWLAELAMYILRHAHITLKKVRGRVVRIVKK